MKKHLNLYFATIFSMVLAPQANAEVHLCGITGELIQSEQPCATPETDKKLSPIKTNRINEDLINSTVKMFRQATVNRDIHAVERFLADDFIFTSNEKDWDGKEIMNTGKQGFVSVMKQHLLAMTAYRQIIESYSVKKNSNQLIAETISTEKIELGDRKIEARLLERIEFVIYKGYLKLQSIKQIELK